MGITSGYNHRAFDRADRRALLAGMAGAVEAHRSAFDGLVCTGVSGLLMAPLIAHTFDLPLMVVRKDGDFTHSTLRVEGEYVPRLLMVDDFIAGGGTVRAVARALEQHTPDSRLVGVLMWRDRVLTLDSDIGKLASYSYDRCQTCQHW